MVGEIFTSDFFQKLCFQDELSPILLGGLLFQIFFCKSVTRCASDSPSG